MPPPQSKPEVASYATAAAAPEGTTEFTRVTNRNKNKNKKAAAPKILKPMYDPNDQRVVMQVHPTPPAVDVQTTWKHLRLASKAVREYQKDLDYCFVGCCVTRGIGLVLQTPLKTKGSDYLPYLESIKTAVEEEEKLKIILIGGESRWIKFVLHGAPISCTMDEVALSIQQSYPETLKLAQILRANDGHQATGLQKELGTVVLAIAGQHTLQ